jgi:hypothetical protein
LTGISEVLTASIIRAITSETWVNFYQTARRNIPEDSHLPFLTDLHNSYSLISFLLAEFNGNYVVVD